MTDVEFKPVRDRMTSKWGLKSEKSYYYEAWWGNSRTPYTVAKSTRPDRALRWYVFEGGGNPNAKHKKEYRQFNKCVCDPFKDFSEAKEKAKELAGKWIGKQKADYIKARTHENVLSIDMSPEEREETLKKISIESAKRDEVIRRNKLKLKGNEYK